MTIKNCLLAVTLLGVSVLSQAQPKSLDKIVAIVDDDIILQSELKDRVTVVKKQSKGMRLPPDQVLRDQVLERLIVESIQLQMAERSGMRVSDQQLNQTVEQSVRPIVGRS